MNASRESLTLALLLMSACGRPLLSAESGGETSGGDSTTSATSTDTGTETSTETSSETGTTSNGSVPELDMTEDRPCELYLQDCPEGEKCVPYSQYGGTFDSTKCVPVVGDGAPGEPCTYDRTRESPDDCDAASFCWDTFPDGMGTCRLFCTGFTNDPQCPEDHVCLFLSGFSTIVCVPTCDPIAQDCSGEDLACYWTSWFFQCSPMGDIALGEPCGYVNDCAGGHYCVDAVALPLCEGQACCAPYCEFGGGGQECEALPGTTCVSFFEEGAAPPDYEHVGLCVVPP